MTGIRIRIALLILADLVALAGSWLATLMFCHWIFGTDFLPFEYLRLYPALLFFLVLNGFIRLYHGNIFYPGAAISPIEELRRMFFSVVCTGFFAFAYISMSRAHINISRLVVLLSCPTALIALPVARFLVRKIMKMFDFGQIDVIILGAGLTGQVVSSELAADIHFGLRAVGFFDDRRSKSPNQLPLLGKVADAKKFAARHHINYCICCLPVDCVPKLAGDMTGHFLHFTFMPDIHIFPVALSYPFNFHGLPGLELRNQRLMPMPRICKQAFEFVFSLAVIVCGLPLLGVLALAVKVSSPGPVLYRARRIGKNGREIRVLKFRTMNQDADEQLKKLLDDDPEKKAEFDAKFKLDDDPRITPIGRFLRKSSLDELPQLWNVIKGDMAVIGPRPIVRSEIPKYGAYYKLLKSVKPGITGLWQVSGRSDLDYPLRVNLDMNYIMNWTLWMDYYIFLKTVREIISCRGAK